MKMSSKFPGGRSTRVSASHASIKDIGTTYAIARKAGASRFGAARIAGKQAKINKLQIKAGTKLGSQISKDVAATASGIAGSFAAQRIAETSSNESIAKAALAKGLTNWNSIINQDPNNPTTSDDSSGVIDPASSGSAIGG